MLLGSYSSFWEARYWRVRTQIESSAYYRDLKAFVESLTLVGDNLQTRRSEIDRFFTLKKSFPDPSFLSGGKLVENTRRYLFTDATGQFSLQLLVKNGAIVRNELRVGNRLDLRRKPVIDGNVEQVGAGNVASRRT
jgi:hypothetical protein